MATHTLYIVPTPIGNLSDMTYRAVQTLQSVAFIYAEDTRTSAILLHHYQIKTPVLSYHRHNEAKKTPEIIDHLKSGKNVAIISDAGTPGICDPSNKLIARAIKENITICPLPGSTALIPALCASGFDTSQFHFIGFLPHKKKDRLSILTQIKDMQIPIVFYEAPHRLHDMLIDLQKAIGNADISIARELTKIYETFYRGRLDDILQGIDKIVIKGEFAIVAIPEKKTIDIVAAIHTLYDTKYHDQKLTTASRHIATELDISKNLVYDILLKYQTLS
jgi:16S rRNA (cytidine1402-2'-O)-methyltransferase